MLYPFLGLLQIHARKILGTHDFLTPCTMTFVNYHSATVSYCSDGLAQLLPYLNFCSVGFRNRSVQGLGPLAAIK